MAKPSVTVALAGNPNVGKSTVFNSLTGLRQHTGNWAGKTVETARGLCESAERRYTVVDLPGAYSLHPRSAEEEAARDYLLTGQAQAVVVVCDGSCLGRGLRLVLEMLTHTRRVLVCVNLLDEAARRGLTLDLPRLSELLGLPVVGLVARRRGSRETLLGALDALLDGAEPTPAFHPEELPQGDEDALSAALVHSAEALAEAVTTVHPSGGEERQRRLDQLVTGALFGYPLMLLLLGLLLYLTVSGANVLSDGLAALLERVEGLLAAGLDACAPPLWLRSLLLDGVWRVLAWVTAVMLPPMALFFPLFSLLEDLGYLPRVAFNLDRPFRRCHACGKQALTICMGLGCNAAGVMGCRIIENRRERLLAMLTNAITPCNGRFPMLLTIWGLFFTLSGAPALTAALGLLAALVFSVVMSLAATRLLAGTVLRGEAEPFVLELPPWRLPQPGRILLRSLLEKTLVILARAVKVAAPAGALLWLLGHITPGGVSLLARAAALLEPVGRFFGLDGAILLAFLLGLPANETVLPILLMLYAGQGTLAPVGDLEALHTVLTQQGWTRATALCVLVFCVLHWPCSTTLLTIRRESGSWGWAALSAILPTALGLTLCALIHAVSMIV